MMRGFVEAAIDLVENEEIEALREKATEVIVQGFSKVPLTPSFREAVADCYGTSAEEVTSIKDDDLVQLGLQSLTSQSVKDAFLFHASLVDEFWKTLTTAK